MSYFLSGSFVVKEWSKGIKNIRFPPHVHDNFSYTFDFEVDSDDDKISICASISEYSGYSHEIKIVYSINNYKESEKSIESTVVDSFSIKQSSIRFILPIKASQITEENGWIKDDSFTVKYEITHGSSKPKEQEKKKEENWKIPNFELEEPFRSPTYKFIDLSYYIERRIDYRNIDFFIIVENISSPMQFNAKLVISSSKKTIEKERKCSFKASGDLARFIMGYEVQKLDDLLDNGTLNVKLELSKIDTTLSNVQPPPLPPPPPIAATSALGAKQVKEEKHEILPFAGLKNQGATCYLNSLLQSLFHIPSFRSLVFSLPTKATDNLSYSIPLALQILFARMQLDNHPCSTQGLTLSFGWTDYQSFIQQDIQELCRVLLANLSEKLLGTSLEGKIDELFKGETRNFIECVNVPYESSRKEYFYDLQMQVRGCPTLEDSFKLMNAKEFLNGANQYNAEGYGKQDAYMGQEFTKLPPILHIHLARFEYDYDMGYMTKINEKQSFPDTIDLAPYTKSSEVSGPILYDLFGVLVHAGSINSGHYYAYIRPSKSPDWFCFNDQNVKQATHKEAVEDNFGGGRIDKGFSAYMLVYVKQSEIDNVFLDVSNEKIPEHVREYIKENPDDEKAIRKQTVNARPIIYTVTSEGGLKANARKGLISFAHENFTKDITMMSDRTVSDLYDRVAEDFEVKDFKLWQCFSNGSPALAFERSDKLLEDAKQFPLFIQTSKCEGEIVLYCFFYLPNIKQPLQYIRSIASKKTDKIQEVCMKANSIIGFEQATPLFMYEATDPLNMRKLDYNYSLEESGITNGNIVVFQVDPNVEIPEPKIELDINPEELANVDSSRKICKWSDMTGNSSLATIDMFYQNKVGQVIINIFTYNSLENVGYIEIPRNCSLKDLKQLVAFAAKIELTANDSMQLFKRDPKNDIPMSSPISHTMKTVDMIFPQSTKREPLLYFVVFKGITDLELMGMRSYVIEYSEDCIHVTKRARVAIDKVGKAMQLCNTLRKMGITCKEDDNLRLSLVKNGKFVKVFSPDDELPTSVSTIRVDVVSYEDLHPSDDERVLQFVLCAPDPMKNAKPLNMCFMKRVKLDSKISEIKLLAKEAFGVDEDLNFMFGQELAKVTKSSFFDEHSTIKEILSKDKREDPPIYVIKKSTDKVGVMSCTEANQSIVIYN